MRIFEVALAALFTLGGLRSLWLWGRRRFESTVVVDQLLYALYLTGRVGLWFAFAGLFSIYASSDAKGRAFIDEVQRFRWYAMVPIGMAALQLVTGYALGRRSPD
ncbi:MAG: hypothetical protein HYU54_01070 [Actinobacteria bacterium]|nr:hypothetical protein [Actinomycetota bacterium]